MVCPNFGRGASPRQVQNALGDLLERLVAGIATEGGQGLGDDVKQGILQSVGVGGLVPNAMTWEQGEDNHR